MTIETARRRPRRVTGGIPRLPWLWKELLAAYEPPPLDPGAAEAIDAFIACRRAEIESAP